MVLFFFYANFTNIELLKKINNTFEINDGYIIIESYDKENNVLKINNKIINNNTFLYGKLVNFNMNLEDIIQKINEIPDCKFVNKTSKYILDTIYATKMTGGIYKAYIIY